MKTFAIATLSLLGVLFAACCGSAAIQSFTLQKPSTTSTSGKVLFELKASSSAEPVKLSNQSIVLTQTGSTNTPTAPSPSPWALELVTDENGNGEIDANDVVRVVQLDGVEGGADLTSGKSYDVTVFETEPAKDAVSPQMTFVTWTSTWTAP
jgi:hypothetical protein